ncbi:hypothetical protein [Rubellimicrobium roseum]|uniref:Uncharacterized protein n=1 Tax=Rubellimicrobium roseum TaxID=687525 RepID=A0A5C4N5X3_9RHOB|nr:hypothetical protein [Rubellimicrobium roseum]TNC59307.1 hypothetical protein FHG71_22970 [Rubellimicrobium roseum]
MYFDRATINEHWKEREGQLPALPSAIVLRKPDLPDEEVAHDPAEDDLWLRRLALWGDAPLDQKLVEAVGLVAEWLEQGPGRVELIVTPAYWHSFPEVVVFRPLQDGVAPILRVFSLRGIEELICSWRAASKDPGLQRRRGRRAQAPVRLVFDRGELVVPAAPTRWDLMLYVTHRVRRHYEVMKRI